jgi:hypothetical protein
MHPLKVNRRFGGTCRLRLTSRRINQARNEREAGCKQIRAEDGGDMFLRNVGWLSTDYTSFIVVGVFTDPLPTNGRLFIRLLHRKGCTRYNILIIANLKELSRACHCETLDTYTETQTTNTTSKHWGLQTPAILMRITVHSALFQAPRYFRKCCTDY